MAETLWWREIAVMANRGGVGIMEQAIYTQLARVDKENDMNYRTASMDQLRTERVRLTNMLHVFQQRRDSSVANRGGREAGYRSNATTHQQDRELQRLTKQLAELDAELVWRDEHAKAEPTGAAAGSTTPADPTTTDV
jgi:hypothetical protein